MKSNHGGPPTAKKARNIETPLKTPKSRRPMPDKMRPKFRLFRRGLNHPRHQLLPIHSTAQTQMPSCEHPSNLSQQNSRTSMSTKLSFPSRRSPSETFSPNPGFALPRTARRNLQKVQTQKAASIRSWNVPMSRIRNSSTGMHERGEAKLERNSGLRLVRISTSATAVV